MARKVESILKQGEIAAHIGKLISRVRKLEKAVRDGQRLDELDDGAPPTDGNPQENRFLFYATIVTSLVDDSTFLGDRAAPSESGWAADATFAGKPLTVTVPTGITRPAVDDVVGVFFTGTYITSGTSIPIARYGLFGAGGGGGYTQTKIQSIGDDHLVVRSYSNSVLGSDDILVAKNYKNRRTPFDGLTVGDYSYVYSTAVDRVVTIAASTSFKQLETIIPRYNVDDLLYVAEADSTDVTLVTSTTSLGTPVETALTFIDANLDNREFVRVGVV